MTRATTVTLLALALLALCQLSTSPVEARELLKKKKKKQRGPSALEAAQLAAQVAAQEQLVAQGQAQIAAQARAQARKNAGVAAKQAKREAAQLAAQVRAQARLVAQGQAQIAAQARAQARKAARAAGRKKGGKKGRRANTAVEAAAADPTPTSGGGSTGPIWGMQTGRGGGGPVARATYHYYAPGYETSSLYCADAFAKYLPAKPDTFLLQYPWTAYCNDQGLGPMSQDKCGRCLKVTNTATGQSVKTRVVDLCGTGGVDMDPLGFNAIDGNGAGVRDGHMDVRLEWC